MAYHILLPIYFFFQLFLNMILKFFHYFKYLIPHSLFLVFLIIFFIFTKTNFEMLLQFVTFLSFHYFQKYDIFFYNIIHYYGLILLIFPLNFLYLFLFINIFHSLNVNSLILLLPILLLENLLHLTYNSPHQTSSINSKNLHFSVNFISQCFNFFFKTICYIFYSFHFFSLIFTLL